MSNKDALINIGMSRAEALVYLELLKLGKTKSGNLIKKTGLQSSVVHNSLNSLINKGFVTYVLEGKVKNYLALEPKLIEDSLEAKKQEFKKFLPSLELLKNRSEAPIKVEVYDGFNGLYHATLSMIKDCRQGETYKYFAAEKIILSEGALEFFEKIDLIKKSKKILIKGIAKTSDKDFFKDYKNSQIKFTAQEIPPAMNIFRDKILIISLSEKPTGILIQSKEIAKQYNDLWDSIWKTAR